MRVEKENLFPLSVILLFMLVIPFAMWIGFATRKQIVQDLSTFAKVATLIILGFALLVACSILWSQRRGRRILAERGEQVVSNFSRQFAGESQQRAAFLIFDVFKSMTASKRMPRLDRNDRLDGPPLFLASEDLAEHLEELLATSGYLCRA